MATAAGGHVNDFGWVRVQVFVRLGTGEFSAQAITLPTYCYDPALPFGEC